MRPEVAARPLACFAMERAVILYDSDCGMCRVCVALVLTWDRRARLHPIALDSAEASALLGSMPVAEREGSWHLVAGGGEVHSAGAAFPPLLRQLPGGRPLAAVMARLPRATERGYRWVAGHRSQIGGLLPGAVRRWADERIPGSSSR